MTNLDDTCNSTVGNNLIAPMARWRLSRSIKSWSACGVYLFMYFYGFQKNDVMTSVGCRKKKHTSCFAETLWGSKDQLALRSWRERLWRKRRSKNVKTSVSHEIQHLHDVWCSTMHCSSWGQRPLHLEKPVQLILGPAGCVTRLPDSSDVFNDNLPSPPLIWLPCFRQWITFHPFVVFDKLLCLISFAPSFVLSLATPT